MYNKKEVDSDGTVNLDKLEKFTYEIFDSKESFLNENGNSGATYRYDVKKQELSVSDFRKENDINQNDWGIDDVFEIKSPDQESVDENISDQNSEGMSFTDDIKPYGSFYTEESVEKMEENDHEKKWR